MLKLEKVAKSRELNVILRDKPTLFTRSFLMAFGYALFCHFFALFIFQISPFKISYQPSLIPPVLVASDFNPSDPNHYVTAFFDQENHIPEYLIPPQFKTNRLPDIAKKIIYVENAKIIHYRSFEQPFSLENNIEIQPLVNHFTTVKKTAPFSVSASGGISDSALIVDKENIDAVLKRFATYNPSLHSNIPYHVVFSVMVNQENGEIFWWKTISGKTDGSILWLAISLLQNLSFERGLSHSFANGNIELTINLSRVEIND